MYTAQALYSQEVLGRIKAQKRSEYNCNYYKETSATGSKAKEVTLDELKKAGENTF